MHIIIKVQKNLDKDKINKCYQRTKKFLEILRHMHRKLIAANDPEQIVLVKKLQK